MSVEEDVASIKTDVKWLVREWGSRSCDRHDARLEALETWRTFLAGAWAVICLLAWIAWDAVIKQRFK